MGKKKQKQQTFLSPENYIRQKARTLPIKVCYVNDDFESCGLGNFVIVREHTGGNVTMGIYLVDKLCLGVKNTSYKFRISPVEYDDILFNMNQNGFVEISYNEAHNWIYGALEFAGEAGIKPHKDFALTRYLLEEDTENVPLIEYEYGKNGKHFFVANSMLEANTYLPTLTKHLGENFDWMLNGYENEDDEDLDWDGFDDEEAIPEIMSNLENSPLFKDYGPSTEYTYKHPEYPSSITVENPVVEQILCDPSNAIYLKRKQIDTLLVLPHDSLRHDLEQLILYHTGLSCDGIPDEIEEKPFVGVIGLAIMLLAEVGNSDTSLDVVLEILRQSSDFKDYHLGDAGEDTCISTIYKLGQNSLDKLMDFMKEEGLDSFAKSFVPQAVVMIAQKHPERRSEVLEWFRKLLLFATEKIAETQWIDSTLAGLIVSEVINIRAKELLPEIKALHNTGLVDIGINGPYHDVEKYIMGHLPIYQRQYITDIYERFNDMRKRWG